MITRIEALNYRCLHYIATDIQNFNVLSGANASGKTTFIDVLTFLAETLNEGPLKAIEKRANSITELFWNHSGNFFDLAVEAQIPETLIGLLPDRYTHFRYEIKIGIDEESNETGILGERGFLKNVDDDRDVQGVLFPEPLNSPETIYSSKMRQRKIRNVFHKVPQKNDNFYSETMPNKGKGWLPAFKFGLLRSALQNLPDDGSRFPVATWFRNLITSEVVKLVLNSESIKQASAPGLGSDFLPDGRNMPWVLHKLKLESQYLFNEWVEHVKTALPDITSIDVLERHEDRHKYISVEYTNSLKVPSWLVSDGTLRFLALTLIAYIPDFNGVYLIEEPENGIHPKAVDALVQSLASIFDGQVILATHSPNILSRVPVENIFCFSKRLGSTAIVNGINHPALADWQRETTFGTMFASGILD